MKIAMAIIGAYWFLLGTFGAYYDDTSVKITIARFSLALFIFFVIQSMEIMNKLDKIMKGDK